MDCSSVFVRHHVCRRKLWKSSSLRKVDIVSRKFSEKHNTTMYCSTISLVSITITFDCKITTQKPTLTLMKMSFRCFDFQNVFVAEFFSVQCVTSNDRCCNRPVHFPDLVSWPSSLGFDCPYMDVHLFLCSCWYLRFKEGHRKRRKKIPHTGILLVISTKRLESICPLLLPFTTFGRRRRYSTSSNTEQRSSRWEITDGLKRFWQTRGCAAMQVLSCLHGPYAISCRENIMNLFLESMYEGGPQAVTQVNTVFLL